MLASFSVHVPVWVALEGLGAKHDTPLLDSMEDAKAPEESSCKRWRPALAPFHSVNVSWKPVITTALLNRKSW